MQVFGFHAPKIRGWLKHGIAIIGLTGLLFSASAVIAADPNKPTAAPAQTDNAKQAPTKAQRRIRNIAVRS